MVAKDGHMLQIPTQCVRALDYALHEGHNHIQAGGDTLMQFNKCRAPGTLAAGLDSTTLAEDESSHEYQHTVSVKWRVHFMHSITKSQENLLITVADAGGPGIWSVKFANTSIM